MTGYLFIRHASTDHVGCRLAGRSPGARLNDAGRVQVAALARSLDRAPVEAVYTSPRERAVETAEPIADALGLVAGVREAFDEVDFGRWTGRAFDDLEGDPAWRAWNESRSTARPPGGESMADVLARALGGLSEIETGREGKWVVVVSHCDVIRPLLAHFAGLPLDHMLRLEVSTASVSTVVTYPWGARILGVNATPTPVWGKPSG